MAVYTSLSKKQIEEFLSLYELGELTDFCGIAEGVSNSNYLLTTSEGRYILTLFEPHRVIPGDIPFFLGYAAHLSAHDIPVPAPLETKAGEAISELVGKPAVIVPFMTGQAVTFSDLTPAHCNAAGEMAARMHMAGADFEPSQPNRFGLERMKRWIKELGAGLNQIEQSWHQILVSELQWLEANWPENILPQGAIHADYFPDNVFFNEQGHISAVLDFHFACTDSFAFDLAVIINAWCFTEKDQVQFDPARYRALLTGYQAHRPLKEDEIKALPLLLRAAALRTTLARCEELLSHKADDLMVPHDPKAYYARLCYFQNHDVTNL